MPFYVVQPWGRDRYRQATVQSIHDTVEDAYAQLDGSPRSCSATARPLTIWSCTWWTSSGSRWRDQGDSDPRSPHPG